MKEKVYRIINDSFLSLSWKICFVCVGLHLYQYLDSNRIEPLVRMVLCALYLPTILFFGRKGSSALFWIYANYLAVTMDFQNYTAFVIITVLTMLLPRFKIPLLCNYAIDVFIVSTLHNKTPVHILIHILNCILFYYAIVFLLKPTVNKKKLELTTDEILIVEELLTGKQQKEIEQFSQNTVTNKLKEARKRNGISTTDELLLKYRETSNLFHRTQDDTLQTGTRT